MPLRSRSVPSNARALRRAPVPIASRSSLALALALCAVSHESGARACAPAPGYGERVSVNAEDAMIVWDRATQVEHFIRRANFSTDADDFGFLVPTPTPPDLGEVGEEVFDRLDERTAPVEVVKNEYRPITCVTAPFELMLRHSAGADESASPGGAGVEVLATQRVAGLDATVLRATDADALAAWLGEHGFENRGALRVWLRPYVNAGFAITAFRYEKGAGSSLGTRAVRMSFRSERPFYPYREPADQPESFGRVLRVHVVTTGRVRGVLGDAPWPEQADYARPLDDGARLLAGVVPEVPRDAWLTRFSDRRSRRPEGDDLTFEGDEAFEVVPTAVRTREVLVPAPIELVVLAAGIVWLVRKRRRRASASR
jgi:hypothetical protein